MRCDHCGRGVPAEHFHGAPGVVACSLICLNEVVRMRTHKDGRAYAAAETDAIEAGGKAAGAYLEQIGKFDLREMTRDEWLTFLHTFDAQRSAVLRDAIPF